MARRKSPMRQDPRINQMGDLPDWLKGKVRRQVELWQQGMLRTCLHDPRSTSPVPVWMAAWKPELVVCGQCTHLLLVIQASDEACRCDGCSRVTEGTDDDRVYSARVTVGPLTYEFAVCKTCRVAMT